MAKKNSIQLGEAIKELLETYQLTSKLDEVKLVNLWPKVVGEVINKHTTKIWVSGEVLYVRLDAATLKQELLYSQGKVVQELNKEMGKEVIKAIKIS